jgi:23S rRNA (adenine2503-C2)-methyltransferase
MDAINGKSNLRDLSAQEVQDLLVDLGEKPFRARQVLNWLYKQGAGSIEEMTNLSKGLRERLSQTASLHHLEPAQVETSQDGTRKLLFELADGARVESVLIPEQDHSTLCISSQAGCRQGCRFCRTASLGFQRNLTPAEITGQVLTARAMSAEDRPLTNLVFMGMGEPLDNLDNLNIALEHILGDHGLQMSQRRVTVSTVGLVDRLAELGRCTPAALAVSLNAPNDELRSRLMPVNTRFPLAMLKEALLAYPLKPTRRITLEYVLLAGINDQPEHARELAKWVHGLKCKVNLIAFNPHPGSEFERPDDAVIERFQKILIDKHITALLRASRGSDISAACGQLAAKPA